MHIDKGKSIRNRKSNNMITEWNDQITEEPSHNQNIVKQIQQQYVFI